MVAATLTFGEIISWTPPTEVAFDKLREAMAKVGIDAKMAGEMLPRNAFARAAHKLEENRIIRPLEEDAVKIRFQFTREYLNEIQGEYFYSKEAVLELVKKTGEVECSDAALAAKVKALIDAEIGVRKAADVTRLVQRIFDKQGGDLVAIRETGGAYFVPRTQVEIVERVEEFLEAISGRLLRFAIGGSNESTSKSVAESMTDHFHRLIEEFRKSCENVSPDSSASMMKRRKQRIEELRFKLGTFREMLQENAEGIDEALSWATKDLEKRRAGNAPELTPVEKPDSTPEAVPEPVEEPAAEEESAFALAF